MWIIFRNTDNRWLGATTWVEDAQEARRISADEASTILWLHEGSCAACFIGAGSPIPHAGEGQKIMEKLVEHAMSAA